MCVSLCPYTGLWCVSLCIHVHDCCMSPCMHAHDCDVCTCITGLDVSLCVSTVLDSGVHHFVHLFLQALVCVTCSHIPWCVSAYISTHPGVCYFCSYIPWCVPTYISAYPGVRHFVFRGLNLMCVTFCFSIYIGLWCVSLCAHQRARF